LATCGGTIYMKRLSTSALLPVSRAITEAVADGVTVVLFLEGTTTDGSMVLPFHSALLEPAVKNKWEVTPCHIHYTSTLGQTADGVSWHGDVHFFEHLLRMLRVRRIDATAVFGYPVSHQSRKELASILHREVCRLGRLVQRVPEPFEP
jgi:1-acyl-sn-glycerol-3-phosphate acyltransferase